ncbi:Mur ligase family protein [Candidatus Clostridium radicumherbarum]|uniref:Mur ligase family protein n=1 Tax=Candidatus Clostridium radicumherbarum TaxID=3381662 RepID=A0ABW8TN80_9CLOT
MKIASLKVFEGNNIKGHKKIIKICIKSADSLEIRTYLKMYFQICYMCGFKEKLIDCENIAESRYIWLTYTEEEFSKYLLCNIQYYLDNPKLLAEKSENLIKKDFLYYVINLVRQRGIPTIELNEDLFQVGYGKNSIILGRDYQSYENTMMTQISRNRMSLWEKLRYSQIPKVQGRVLYGTHEIKEVADFNYPINIRNINKCKEVKVTINNEEELNTVLDNVLKTYTRAFVYNGRVKFRVICYKGQVLLVLRKDGIYKVMEVESKSLEVLEVVTALRGLESFCAEVYRDFPIEFMYIDLQEDKELMLVDLGNVFDAYEELDNVKDKIANCFINKLIEEGIGAIPIFSVTGTNGKTTTARLIYYILNNLGFNTALTSTGGIFVNGKKIRNGDTTGFLSARSVLCNNTVEAAVMETARGGILKNGLGYEKACSAVITSLSEDHIGMSGIKDVQDLLKIKAVVLEELDYNGKIVVKAQEDLVNYTKSKKNVCLFSIEKNKYILEQIRKGGECFYLENENLIYNKNEVENKLLNIKEIPFTHGGYSKGNILNIMAATGAVLNICEDVYKIMGIIKEIKCDLYFNPGRQNILEIEDFKVILDYGHNSEAFNEVLSIARSLKPSRLTAIIAAPGDRMDKYIKELGSITADYSDNIIIREQADLRGRSIGESASLLKIGSLERGFNEKNIKIIYKEEEAIVAAMEEAIEGEVIVLFTQCLDVIIPAINRFLEKKGKAPIGADLDFSH